MAITFSISHRAADCDARVGRVQTPHGSFDTPAFMPVGTQGTIKGLLPEVVKATGSQICLANTYHLLLRPGSELVAQMGGLHKWMRWDRPILTDSGGFQVFSLADTAKITDEGVSFRSHLDGALVHLTPERSMQVQNELGSDVIMAFDECPPASEEGGGAATVTGPMGTARRHGVAVADYPARVRAACERSIRWLDRCVEAHQRKDEQALFGIVQGGVDLAMRSWSAAQTTARELPGYAIGGVAVGEGFEGLKKVVEHTAPLLPTDRPRYLMGVGYERDIYVAVRAGVDMFDCVLPTRNGRNANAFTPTGQVRLRNARFKDDPRPIDETCDCTACGGGFSRSYIRHLFQAEEMLGPVLVSVHNIRHFQRYLLDIRRAIVENAWSSLLRRWPIADPDGM